MKRLILAGIVALSAFATVQVTAPKAAAAGRCDGVRCMACPEGFVLSPTGNDCCRCVPIN
jgi:hypothetical protein